MHPHLLDALVRLDECRAHPILDAARLPERDLAAHDEGHIHKGAHAGLDCAEVPPGYELGAWCRASGANGASGAIKGLSRGLGLIPDGVHGCLEALQDVEVHPAVGELGEGREEEVEPLLADEGRDEEAAQGVEDGEAEPGAADGEEGDAGGERVGAVVDCVGLRGEGKREYVSSAGPCCASARRLYAHL